MKRRYEDVIIKFDSDRKWAKNIHIDARDNMCESTFEQGEIKLEIYGNNKFENLENIKKWLFKLKGIIKWEEYVNIIFIGGNYGLLQWSARPMYCSGQRNIIINTGVESDLINRYTSIPVINNKITEEKLINVILEEIFNRKNACRKKVKWVSISYENIVLLSELIYGGNVNNKSLSRKKNRLKEKYGLKTDLDMIIFYNFIWKLPESLSNIKLRYQSYIRGDNIINALTRLPPSAEKSNHTSIEILICDELRAGLAD